MLALIRTITLLIILWGLSEIYETIVVVCK